MIKKQINKLLSLLRGDQNLEKLIKRGLIIGTNCKIMSGVIIDPSHCFHIEIGNEVVIAPNVHILAHDTGTKMHLGYTKVANVYIGNRVFIGAGSIILPGVKIGDEVVIGAGSVVAKDVPAKSVVAGVPAKHICSLDEYLQKNKALMSDKNVFDDAFTLRNPDFSALHAEKLKTACEQNSCAFVE